MPGDQELEEATRHHRPAEILTVFMTRALARTHQPKNGRSQSQPKHPDQSADVEAADEWAQ
jgi:hypothetical protein